MIHRGTASNTSVVCSKLAALCPAEQVKILSIQKPFGTVGASTRAKTDTLT